MSKSLLDQEKWNTLEDTIVNCRRCPRLVEWREAVAVQKKFAYKDWEYWGKPVPGFGDTNARVLVVGLAPGAHGSNRTGRMFTGDSSGDFLYSALYRAGFANQPKTLHRDDGLRLFDMYIGAICRCVPPDNKPTRDEITNCLIYLKQEIQLLGRLSIIVALGRIAFYNILSVFREVGNDLPNLEFTHGAVYELGGNLPHLIVSYHPSRQNTQTGRLTQPMFDQIWEMVRLLLTNQV